MDLVVKKVSDFLDNIIQNLKKDTVLTFEKVFRLSVVGTHDGCGLSPNHDQNSHTILGLFL